MFADENKDTANQMHGQKIDRSKGTNTGDFHLDKTKPLNKDGSNVFQDENKFTSKQMSGVRTDKPQGLQDRGMKDNLPVGAEKLQDKPGMMKAGQEPFSNNVPSTAKGHGKKGQKGHLTGVVPSDTANWFNKRATRPF